MARYGCHVDLTPGEKPDGCVLDKNRTIDCRVAQDLDRRGLGKTDCPHWLPIAPSPEQAELSRLRELVKEMREAIVDALENDEAAALENGANIGPALREQMEHAIAKADAILGESAK